MSPFRTKWQGQGDAYLAPSCTFQVRWREAWKNQKAVTFLRVTVLNFCVLESQGKNATNFILFTTNLLLCTGALSTEGSNSREMSKREPAGNPKVFNPQPRSLALPGSPSGALGESWLPASALYLPVPILARVSPGWWTCPAPPSRRWGCGRCPRRHSSLRGSCGSWFRWRAAWARRCWKWWCSAGWAGRAEAPAARCRCQRASRLVGRGVHRNVERALRQGWGWVKTDEEGLAGCLGLGSTLTGQCPSHTVVRHFQC